MIALGYLGSKPPEGDYVCWARVFTAYYFLHLLVDPADRRRDGDGKAAAALDHRVRARQGRQPYRRSASGGRDSAMGTIGYVRRWPRRRWCWRLALASGAPAWAAGDEHALIDRQKWTFAGLLGNFDQGQLQRGFKVYAEVCARCHGVKRLAFRNLAEPGGPGFPEAGVKSLAATYKVDAEPNDQGKVVKRPAILTDSIPSPFKNEQEARATLNGGAAARSVADRQGARHREQRAVLHGAAHHAARHRRRLSGGGRRLHLRLSDGLHGTAGRARRCRTA